MNEVNSYTLDWSGFVSRTFVYFQILVDRSHLPQPRFVSNDSITLTC